MSDRSRQPRSDFLTAYGVLIHYEIWGDSGPDVILVPGITSPAPMWGFVAERMAAFARVFVMDVRGRGLSDRRETLSYRERDCARDVIALARRLHRPLIVGHSMGGRIGVAAAAFAPELFSGLIAADPPVSGPGRRHYPTPLVWYLDAMEELANGGGYEAARRATPTWSEELTALRAKWLPTCSREAVIGAYNSFHEDSMHELLPRVMCPTLLLYAEHGDTIREEDAAEFVDLLPDGQAQRIDDAGHMIPYDQLTPFVDAVRAFVTEHGATR